MTKKYYTIGYKNKNRIDISDGYIYNSVKEATEDFDDLAPSEVVVELTISKIYKIEKKLVEIKKSTTHC